jgi:hypothetical protein
MIPTGENRSTGRGKPVTVPLLLSQILHEPAWDRARTSVVRGRRLTTEADRTEAIRGYKILWDNKKIQNQFSVKLLKR